VDSRQNRRNISVTLRGADYTHTHKRKANPSQRRLPGRSERKEREGKGSVSITGRRLILDCEGGIIPYKPGPIHPTPKTGTRSWQEDGERGNGGQRKRDNKRREGKGGRKPKKKKTENADEGLDFDSHSERHASTFPS
jgi:hypothetical protein